MKKATFLACIASLVLVARAASAAGVQAAATRPAVEVGTVRWQRDFDASLLEARESGRPLFVLFQEVPGCAGCRTFGREVLSNPALAAQIEKEFIPVLVYNNRPGKDAEILARYGEPAWNYQVVRFLDGNGNDVIPRKDRVWTLKGVAARMIKTLETLGRIVPPELERLAE